MFLCLQIANVVSEETHLPVFSPEVMEVRPRELDAMGAVLIEGPKYCGKTTLASQQPKRRI